MVFQNDILAGSSGASGTSTAVHTIDQSIRFNFGDSPYMYKTPSITGNRKKFTNSFWFKPSSKLGVYRALPSVHTTESGGSYGMFFSTADVLQVFTYFNGSSWQGLHYSNRVFRDVSAWYHFVWAVDTTQAVSSERVRIYINGVRETSWSSESYPSLNQDTSFNHSGEAINIGKDHNAGYYPDGYGAEIHYLDGYAYGPEYFGEFNSDGIWIPKQYTGSYGTNGFYIKGEDSADLGNDSSGNNNDFTASGLAAHDQVSDSPTNNWCVMNLNNTNSSMTLSNGNLQSTASAHTGSGASILLPSTGKWYCEFRYNSGLNNEYPVVGVYNTIKNLSTTAVNPGLTSGDLDIGFGVDGRRNEDNTKTTSWMNTIANGNIGAIAIDTENKKIWFGHNNSGSFVWQASGDPSAGTNEANTKDFADDLIFGNSHYGGTNLTWNFGQDGTFGGTETAQGNSDANGVGNFYYAPPTGYLALCTKNLGS